MENINEKLPEELRKLFWDVKFDELSIEDYPEFICERILEYGDDFSIKFIIKRLGLNRIIEIVKYSRKLDQYTKNYWLLMADEN
jgi:hypothetical protein